MKGHTAFLLLLQENPLNLKKNKTIPSHNHINVDCNSDRNENSCGVDPSLHPFRQSYCISLAFRIFAGQVKALVFYLAFADDQRDVHYMKIYKVQGQRELRNNEYEYLNLSVPTGFPTCGMRLKDSDGWCFTRQPVFDLCFSLTLNCSNPISRCTHADTVLGVNMV